MYDRKKIVAITGRYYPDFSPGSNIVNNVLQEMKNQYNITVIAPKTHFGMEKSVEYCGVNLIRINDLNLMIHNWCLQKIKESNGKIEKKFFNLLLTSKRSIYFFIRLFRTQSISKSYANRIYKTIQKISHDEKIDIIIPSSEPHESMVAAVKYKIKNDSRVKIFSYQLDHFADAQSLYETKWISKSRYKRNLELELLVLKNCEKHYVLPPIYKHYKDEIFDKYLNKIIVTEHPLIKLNNQVSKTESEGKKIKLIYAGSFDLNLRNPTYLFEVLAYLSNSNIQLDLYSFGNCQSVIDRYKIRLGNNLIDHGIVSTERVYQYMSESDILVSVGNNVPDEVPSKLFDYLSFGKPIVHFYFCDSDAYIDYLKPYEHSICLKIDNTKLQYNAERFLDFCQKNKGINIPFNLISEMYREATPEFVANQFITNFNE